MTAVKCVRYVVSFRDDTKRMSDLFVEVRDAKPPQRSKNSAGEGVHADHAQATISGSYSRFSMNSVLSCVSFASPKAYEGPIPRSAEALNRLAMPQMLTLPRCKRAARMQTCCPQLNVLPTCKRAAQKQIAIADGRKNRLAMSRPPSAMTASAIPPSRFHFTAACPLAISRLP